MTTNSKLKRIGFNSQPTDHQSYHNRYTKEPTVSGQLGKANNSRFS